MTPRLYLAAPRAQKGLGSGNRWSIQGLQTGGGRGRIHALRPPPQWEREYMMRRLHLETYRASYLDLISSRLETDCVAHAARAGLYPELRLEGEQRAWLTLARDLSPGALRAHLWGGDSSALETVSDGDTLVSAEGWGVNGIRTWAAEVLVLNGWRCWVDGRELRIPGMNHKEA